jgi:hypothetical protein
MTLEKNPTGIPKLAGLLFPECNVQCGFKKDGKCAHPRKVKLKLCPKRRMKPRRKRSLEI